MAGVAHSHPRAGLHLADEPGLLAFLQSGVRENVALDFKRDFPRNLEKSLAAFANTYGGTILIGVDEKDDGSAQLPLQGIELEKGLSERVVQIGLNAIYPPIIPEVTVIPLGTPNRAVVVVQVTESDQSPHSVEDGTAVYLRAHNVGDRRERRAKTEEIEWLSNKRAKSEAERTRVLKLLHDHADALRDKRKTKERHRPLLHRSRIDVSLVPRFPRHPLAAPQDLALLAERQRVGGIRLAINSLPEGSWRPIAEGVLFEHSLGSSEFQQQGGMFHTCDFWWDFPPSPDSTVGAMMILSQLPSSLLWAGLTLAGRLYYIASFAGLVDIELHIPSTRGAFLAYHPEDFDSPRVPMVDDSLRVRRTLSAVEIARDPLAIARDCQRELYWSAGVNASDALVERDLKTFKS